MHTLLKKLTLVAGLVLLTLAPQTLAATEDPINKDDFILNQGEVAETSLVEGGQTVSIAGTVQGDLFCGGQSVVITGTIEGDVICAGQTVTITGTVTGDVRAAAQVVRINGKVGGSVTIFAQDAFIEKDAVIGRDVFSFAQTMDINGAIGRSVRMAGERLNLRGSIGKNLEADAELFVDPGASIGNNLTYSSSQQASISSGSTIKGTTIWTELKNTAQAEQNRFAKYATIGFWRGVVTSTVSMFLLGLLILRLWQPFSMRITETLRTHPLKSLFVGLGVLVLAPIALFFLLISIIGTPISFFGGLLFAGCALMGRLVTAAFVGEWLTKQIYKNQKLSTAFMLGLGVVVIQLLSALPFLGWMVSTAAFLCGFGALVLNILPAKKST